MTIISAAVEGDLDEAVARHLIHMAGATPGPVYGKTGKARILRTINGYNNAAQRAPWLVLIDLDDDEVCAARLVERWLPATSLHMCFRVAVREVEAWLLADRDNLATFLGISRDLVPRSPESERDPKETMVNLARQSRRRVIREDMVPRTGASRSVGPAYSSRMIEFVQTSWDVERAARVANSLDGAIRCLSRMADVADWR